MTSTWFWSLPHTSRLHPPCWWAVNILTRSLSVILLTRANRDVISNRHHLLKALHLVECCVNFFCLFFSWSREKAAYWRHAKLGRILSMRNFSHGLGVLSASQQSLRISRFHWSLRNRHISRSNVRFQKISVYFLYQLLCVTNNALLWVKGLGLPIIASNLFITVKSFSNSCIAGVC